MVPVSVAEDTDITGKHNILFMSTGIVGGRGKAVVVGTGMNTALGAIQKDVEEADNDEDTPLQKKIGEFGNQLQVTASPCPGTAAWMSRLFCRVLLVVVVVADRHFCHLRGCVGHQFPSVL
jgi:magnesium-transporting ATPase (P-type)